MTVMKEIQLPVSVRWRGGSVARADGRDEKLLELATPPKFEMGLPGYWSPEDLLVVSAASGFVLALAAMLSGARRQSSTPGSVPPAT